MHEIYALQMHFDIDTLWPFVHFLQQSITVKIQKVRLCAKRHIGLQAMGTTMLCRAGAPSITEDCSTLIQRGIC